MVWDPCAPTFPEDNGERATGVNLVEFVGDTEAEVEAPLRRMTASLQRAGRSRAGAASPLLAARPT